MWLQVYVSMKFSLYGMQCSIQSGCSVLSRLMLVEIEMKKSLSEQEV